MKNKDLIKQLNTLKEVRPDSKWNDENRGVLMNQIYGAQAETEAKEFNFFKSFIKTLPRFTFDLASQPAMVVVFILVFVFAGSATSVKLAHNTKPGDSLYIAKIVSEKTKEALTFDDKEKAQLVIRHAQNRAEELGKVLAESNYSDNEAEKLVGDFQKEIQKVKTRLERMNTVVVTEVEEKDNTVEVVDAENVSEEEPLEVFTVNSGKDENGMEVSESAKAGGDLVLVASDDNLEVSTPTTSMMTIITPSDILKEAGELLDGDDYSATLGKLVEANDALEKSIIKEEDASQGSSTDDVIEEDGASSTEEIVE